MNFLRFLFRRHPWPTVVLAVGLVALVWFGGRFVSEVLYFADPAHREQQLAGWMSPRYVAKSWELPPDVVANIMQLSPGHRHTTLDQVAASQNVTIKELQKRVEAAKAALEAERRGGRQGELPAGGQTND
ncbi:hypothetical protein [Pleomorphomonas sp. JP5]|uniref:hypothetical protein n=1 Tax=Pleomorphomonas sp. JP5 TaxID=2942998 RepID=UPI002043AD9D|nr:hypothetical protein [Pleomorphomonas sp. JP5]MCM5557873.1 hypothetical protein [Pleomorphomonas sp. JP5]